MQLIRIGTTQSRSRMRTKKFPTRLIDHRPPHARAVWLSKPAFADGQEGALSSPALAVLLTRKQATAEQETCREVDDPHRHPHNKAGELLIRERGQSP